LLGIFPSNFRMKFIPAFFQKKKCHFGLWSILATFNPFYFRNHELGQICLENTDWKFHMESKEKNINLSEDHQMITFFLPQNGKEKFTFHHVSKGCKNLFYFCRHSTYIAVRLQKCTKGHMSYWHQFASVICKLFTF
jgi:hypothetical protein